MNRIDIWNRMAENILVPTVWAQDEDEYLYIADALLEGGISTMEILQRVKRDSHNDYPIKHLRAIEKIRMCSRSSMVVGAGTLHTAERTQAAIDHGAQFCVSNLVDEKVIETANMNGVLMVPCARDDANVLAAARLGCLAVKLWVPFPAETADKNLQMLNQYMSIFPRMEWLLTGGVSLECVAQYWRAGYKLLVPNGIITTDVVAAKDWCLITHRAKVFVAEIGRAKQEAT